MEWNARAEGSDTTTTPEELLAAAHATCFSMAFSNELKKNGTPPTQVRTSAEVSFIAGTGIHLTTQVIAEGIDEETSQKFAQGAKENCPVSQAQGRGHLPGREPGLTLPPLHQRRHHLAQGRFVRARSALPEPCLSTFRYAVRPLSCSGTSVAGSGRFAELDLHDDALDLLCGRPD